MAPPLLIIDDAHGNLTPLTDILQPQGLALTTIANPTAEQLADEFAALQPELVFLSLLTSTPPTELCETIRQDAAGAIVPIIYVGTGHEAVRSPVDALSQGGDYYFALPLDPPRVLTKVQTYIGQPLNEALPAAPPHGHVPPSAAAADDATAEPTLPGRLVVVPSDEDGDAAGRVADDETVERERIHAKLDQARTLDYFQMLDLDRRATSQDAHQAYHRLAQQFAPQRFSAIVQRDLAPDLQEIHEVLGDAREVLTDADLRESYARHLPPA